MKITIEVGEELFRFTSFQNWVLTADKKFYRCGLPAKNLVCVDAEGRICRLGSEIDRADREAAFPVTVHEITGELKG